MEDNKVWGGNSKEFARTEKRKSNYQQQSQIKRQEKRKKNNKRTCFANIMELSYTTPISNCCVPLRAT